MHDSSSDKSELPPESEQARSGVGRKSTRKQKGALVGTKRQFAKAQVSDGVEGKTGSTTILFLSPQLKVLQKFIVFIFPLVTNIEQVTYNLIISESEMGIKDVSV